METLKELHIVNNWVGFAHTIFAILSMIFGAMVVFNKKGSKRHKLIGHIYVFNMFLLNLSAFAIYNFGRFSLFHFFAAVSLVTLVLGMYPTLVRKPNWLKKHYIFMSWSVVGLYCAFWAEIGVRFFDMEYFWWVVMLATITTLVLGAVVINRKAKKLIINSNS